MVNINQVPVVTPCQLTCAIEGCKCVTKEGDPAAIYKKLNGERFFTGMVSTFGSRYMDPDNVWKLHDAGDDDLNGVSYFVSLNIIYMFYDVIIRILFMIHQLPTSNIFLLTNVSYYSSGASYDGPL